MLGLCTICNSPVGRNQQYCLGCQNELNEARRLLELERAGEADVCYARWMAGSILSMATPSQRSAEREPIRQPGRLFRQKKTKRIERGVG